MREWAEMFAERLVTAEEFARMPHEDGVRTELVRGRVARMTPAGTAHGRVIARLMLALLKYEEATGAARVLAPSGFIIARNPDTVREPDVAVVLAGRFAEVGSISGFFPGAPDVAVEVLSPTERPGALRAKVADYLACGVRLVWVVDPGRKTVTVHAATHTPRLLSEGATLDGGIVLPGFACQVASLFV